MDIHEIRPGHISHQIDETQTYEQHSVNKITMCNLCGRDQGENRQMDFNTEV